MTRLYFAATAARASRALVGMGAAFVLAVMASGCVGSAAPAPTPDPFAGLADRSDQAFRQGLEAYGQGQYRDALTSFESARTLSPSGDPHIDQMIERSRAALRLDSEMQALRKCYESLTPREREVMGLVVSGLLNKQVGGELGISEITVKAHRGQVMRKMKADSLPDLVTRAARLGLRSAPSH